MTLLTKDVRVELRIPGDPDFHESFYPWSWLQQHPFSAGSNRTALDEPLVFLGNEPNPADVTVSYEDVMASDQGVAEWTSKIVFLPSFLSTDVLMMN